MLPPAAPGNNNLLGHGGEACVRIQVYSMRHGLGRHDASAQRSCDSTPRSRPPQGTSRPQSGQAAAPELQKDGRAMGGTAASWTCAQPAPPPSGAGATTACCAKGLACQPWPSTRRTAQRCRGTAAAWDGRARRAGAPSPSPSPSPSPRPRGRPRGRLGNFTAPGSRIIVPAAGPPPLAHAAGRAPVAGPKIRGIAPASLPSETMGRPRARPAQAAASEARPARAPAPDAARDG